MTELSSTATGGSLREADPSKRERQRRGQRRAGTVRLYCPGAAAGAASGWNELLPAVQVLPLPGGVLDVKWCPWQPLQGGGGEPRLAAACADGSVQVLGLRPEGAAAGADGGRRLVQLEGGAAAGPIHRADGAVVRSMALSVAWVEPGAPAGDLQRHKSAAGTPYIHM